MTIFSLGFRFRAKPVKAFVDTFEVSSPNSLDRSRFNRCGTFGNMLLIQSFATLHASLVFTHRSVIMPAIRD